MRLPLSTTETTEASSRHEVPLRPTQAVISRKALLNNLGVVRSAAGDAQVMAVVKANAYGHGLIQTARLFEAAGVRYFGVALVEEGLALRRAGIQARILVLNGVMDEGLQVCLAARLTPVVHDLTQIALLERAARGNAFCVHVELDTGMGRLGLTPSQVEPFIQGLALFPDLRLEGLMTHFPVADQDAAFTRAQLAQLHAAAAAFRRAGFPPTMLHAANSPALFRLPDARLGLVRVGGALYGADPSCGELQAALRLESRVLTLREIERGQSVGYDRSYRAERRTHVASVPLGYGDGLMRSLAGSGSMLVRGRRCRIVGNVSMDLTTIDVTDVPDCAPGDLVTVLGTQGGETISVFDMARHAGTIPYHVLATLGDRVPRRYS